MPPADQPAETGRPVPIDEGRAWSWVAALRAGSTTPWSLWPDDAAPAPASARDLPGAQQLELLRRFNLSATATTAPGTTPAALVERILSVGAVGRGAPDLELVGATTSRSWGPRPTDPAVLSDAELLRFVVTLLAEDVVRAGRAQQPARDTLPLRVRRRLRRRAPGHRLLGDPWLLEPLRDDLLAQGWPLGGPDSSVVLVGTDLATMLVDTFTARAFDDGVAPWRRWLHTGHGDRPLPPRIDLAQVARRWSDEVGAERVVVLADASRATEALPLRRRTTTARPRPSADAVDLARRVAALHRNTDEL